MNIRGERCWTPVARGCPRSKKCYHAKWKPMQPHAVSDAQHSCLAVCGQPQSGGHREQMELAKQALLHCLRENELCMPTDGSGFAFKPGYAIFALTVIRACLNAHAERSVAGCVCASPGRERWIGRRSDARSGASPCLYSWTGSAILALHRIYQRGSNQRGDVPPGSW